MPISSHQAAFTDFTQAIQLNPKFDAAYVKRRSIRFRYGGLDVIVATLGLNRSELVERIGRGIIPIRTK